MPAPEPDSDEALLRDATGGNVKSFERLYERHRARMWRFLWRATGDAHDTDDLLQETFLRALRAADRFRAGRFTAWLYAIALNLVRSQRRRRRRHAEPGPAGAGEDPSDQAARNETAERVRDAIAQLPEPQRAAILLSRYEGLSYEEIAEAEGCSVDAVKQRVRRAMIGLSARLGEQE